MMILKIEEELKHLEGFTEILSVASTYEEDVFVEEPIIYGGAERFILLGLDSLFKVAKLIIEKNGFNRSNDHNEILTKLRDNKVYPEWLCYSLSNKVKYLNISDDDHLRHMDKGELYKVLDEFIWDFRHFKKYVLEYMI